MDNICVTIEVAKVAINIINDLKSTATLSSKKKNEDTKQAGNAVTVNVVEAIAERLIPLIDA